MIRPSVLLLLCCSLLLPMSAVARLPGPLQAVPASKVRDLAEIRSSRVLRVLVNQSRNSSGEVQGQAIGVEYHRLRAFEQYLNGHARDGQEITLKIIPKFFKSASAEDGLEVTRTLSGPIGIFSIMMDQFERDGFAAWLRIVAVIGLNLFLVNLLPIPIVDGGQLIQLGVEVAMGRPLPDRVRAAINYVGLVMVVALMLFALSIDILRKAGFF